LQGGSTLIFAGPISSIRLTNSAHPLLKTRNNNATLSSPTFQNGRILAFQVTDGMKISSKVEQHKPQSRIKKRQRHDVSAMETRLLFHKAKKKIQEDSSFLKLSSFPILRKYRRNTFSSMNPDIQIGWMIDERSAVHEVSKRSACSHQTQLLFLFFPFFLSSPDPLCRH